MAPMYAATLDALSPCIQITCADTISEYVNKKSMLGGPATALEAAEKMMQCAEETRKRLDATPCDDLYRNYSRCLSKNPRLKCQSMMNDLQDCIAKHIGKLD
ncbi:hypothetical protein FisN_16Hu012 [Fistulifera solaris]|uniref:Uncharacterized protein n=1 Tax=Fistulifera solaris TaxID=1519565 RepID=A0A1Z5KGC7_FISSO|nr:hypothetical protein FisN_16Hu012 [Fistulifera solaris]|eukprot:GAX25175.1 hypothetical protein FisN_16Hu012 [Fistulifera solaris]